jgi:hypothetical protein
MSPTTEPWQKGHAILLLFLVACLTTVTAAPGAAKKRTTKNPNSDLSNIVRPQLINGDSDPTLRFPVSSMPGSVFSITYGWLDITHSVIRYQEVQPPNKSKNSFELSRFSINDLKFSRNFLMIRSGKKRENVIFLPQDRWGTIHTGPGSQSAAGRESLGTQSIYKTLLNYDAVLAMVTPPPPPPPPVVAQPVVTPPPQPKVAPPSPPAIVLSAPRGAGADQVIETDESSMVIKGVAMDSAGIPVVTINGTAANMRPQTTQAAEFWSDPVPLQPGGNRIEVTASNTAHLEAKVVFLIHYTPRAAPVQVNPRALGKQDVIALLQGGVSNSRIVEIIKDRGVKFAPTADDVNDIRAQGGNDELIEAIQQAAPHP